MTPLERDRQFIWHPYTSLMPVFEPLMITRAKGIYLYTEDGKEIIDAISSWWVNLHGHSNPSIASAIAEQARTLEHVIFAGFTHQPAIDLASNLLSILPSNQSKVFFSDNGSTAVEVAIKMAIQYWENQNIKSKKRIIAIQGAYHGDTFGAMAVGARSLFSEAFQEYLFDVDFIDFPTKDNEALIVDMFTKLATQGDVAAFIYEPLVQGAAGMRIYHAEILQTLLEIAQANKVITIADEVFTGFGRTGKTFASAYPSTNPDIVCVSKGITGGFMPLGATTCSSAIAKAFYSSEPIKTFYHGHSYTANPIACAAANASFKILTSHECQQSIERISRMQEVFVKKISTNKKVKNSASLGTIATIELKSDEATTYTNSSRNKIYAYFLGKGILLRPLGNIIYILPPYVISDDDLNLIYHEIEKFLEVGY